MKNILFTITSAALLFGACSIDNQLAPSDDVHVIIMESADTVRPLPGDTIQFKFLASTNVGSLEKVEIIDKSFDFDVMPSDASFAMVDLTKDTLYLDEHGYFSRPINTVMVFYPFAVPKDNSMVGDVLSMTFQVSNTEGKTGTVTSCFKVGNIQTRGQFTHTSGYFYGCEANRAYKSDDSTFIKNAKKIDFLCYWDKETQKCYFINPTSEKAIEYMDTKLEGTGIEYERDSMLTTTFIECPMDFSDINDNTINQLDFSQGVDVLEFPTNTTSAVIAYKNSAGRRCVLKLLIYDFTQRWEAKHDFVIIEEEKE